MRTVASYRIRYSNDNEADIRLMFDKSAEIIDRWVTSKGTPVRSSTLEHLILPDNRKATIERKTGELPPSRYYRLKFSEPTNEGTLFVTLIELSHHSEIVELNCLLSEEGTLSTIKPVTFKARCPIVLRTIVGSSGKWKAGINPVSSDPIEAFGPKGGVYLYKIIMAPKRNLPVVCVSERDGFLFYPKIEESLATDLCGVANVVHIDQDASWTITKIMGKEWSCYNGAIRVYWPGIEESSDPRRHPVWTVNRLEMNEGNDRHKAEHLRRQLRRWLFQLSTFSQSGPSLCSEIRNDFRELRVRELRQQAEDSGEWESLANMYSEENAEIRKQNRRMQSENSDLRRQVSHLKTAFEWKRPLPENLDEDGELSLPKPKTLREAIDQAKIKYENIVCFGSDVEHGINDLRKTAGPPDKVLRYIDKIAEMTELRLAGGLQTDPVSWFKSNGVDASDESKSTLNRRSARAARTWNDGDRSRTFRYHLKPSSHTNPDRCVRIYFEFIEERKLTTIGWIGRHPPLD